MPEKKQATVRVREATRKDIPKLIELNRAHRLDCALPRFACSCLVQLFTPSGTKPERKENCE
jgi:hypothetical protein